MRTNASRTLGPVDSSLSPRERVSKGSLHSGKIALPEPPQDSLEPWAMTSGAKPLQPASRERGYRTT